MRTLTRLLLVILVAGAGADCHRRPTKRIAQSDLTYLGAFKLPKLDYTQPGGDLSGCCHAIGVDPATQSLFISMNEGENQYNAWLAEVTIPTPARADCVTAGINGCTGSELPAATIRQAPHDAWGQALTVHCGNASSGCVQRGLYVDGATLYGSAYVNYDAAYIGARSLFARSRDLAAAGVVGPLEVAAFGPGSAHNGGVAGGFLTGVPSAWRDLLGGDTLAANWGISINSRASWGTPAVVFNRGTAPSIPATALVFYDGTHPTLGSPMQPNVQWNDAGWPGGAMFLEGTASILYIGLHTDHPCYGVATQDPALAGTTTPDGADIYCLDYEVMGKGNHGHPWTQRAWVYDANDLAAVKAGSTDRFAVVPVAWWDFTFPQFQYSHYIKASAYDPTTQTIYLVSQYGDAQGCCYNAPIIHAYRVHAEGGSTPPEPIGDPCVETPLTITGITWPAPNGSTSGSWQTNEPLMSAAFGFQASTQTFTATDTRGCVVSTKHPTPARIP
jgi:hypothetical protein